MFAYLDPSTDTRVRREARALADAGHRVAVVGLHRGKAADMTWRTVDGIPMLPVASQGRWQDVAADVRYPWRTRGRTISAVKSALGRGRRGLRDLGTAFAWGRSQPVGRPSACLSIWRPADDLVAPQTPRSIGSFDGASRSSAGPTLLRGRPQRRTSGMRTTCPVLPRRQRRGVSSAGCSCTTCATSSPRPDPRRSSRHGFGAFSGGWSGGGQRMPPRS